MKPEYSNYFIVRKNEINTEILIDFNHTYNKVELTDGDKKGTLDIYSRASSTQVGSIVMNITDAKALLSLLTEVIDGRKK